MKGKKVRNNRDKNAGRGNSRTERGPRKPGRPVKQNKPKENKIAKERIDSDSLIFGRNAVMEVLLAAEMAEEGGKKLSFTLEEILVQDGASGSTSKIMGKAKAQGVKVTICPKEKIHRVLDSYNAFDAKHQGVVGIISPFKYSEISDILQLAKKREEEPLIMLLDGIEDPHNLGAIMRTAECAGVHGIIIPKRRAVAVNDTVIKTSAGAAAHILVAKVSNLVDAMKELQEAGVWISALDMDGTDYNEAKFDGPIGIVVGGEDRGVSRLVRETSDYVVSLPIKGKINSLNASNAAAIVLYKAISQR